MEKPYSATNAPIPQHNTFIFDDIIFSSDFDSGNLAKVEKIDSKKFFLWIGPDCFNTMCEKSFRSWFYFKIAAEGEYDFTIKNMNLQGKLFRDGMKPLVKTPSKTWERIDSLIICDVAGDVGSRFEVSFSYNFKESFAYFAFSFPWTYTEHKNFISIISSGIHPENFYFHHENLIYSLEKRTCDLLTISSYDKITRKFEENIPGLFENSPQRAAIFNKKPVIFISARVHPGETPSSFIINGFIKFLISEDLRAQQLRQLYVFKILPMINPDGVFRGYFRTDTRGNDLNRCYTVPTLQYSPVIYAIKELLEFHKSNLWAYIDCHAHVSKQGCFVYGNTLDFEKQIQNVLFAKIMALSCPWFNFDACIFNEENNSIEEKSLKNNKNSKEGCGRVAIYKQFKITHCYTFECNYHSIKAVNIGHENKERIFDIQTFETIGNNIGTSLLYISGNYEYTSIDIKNVELEVSKLLADQQPYHLDPDIRKASKSIENLTKYINSCKTSKRNSRANFISLMNGLDKPIRTSINISKNNLPKIKNTLRCKIFDQLQNLAHLSTKCITAHNNSFQIRNRDSSYMKIKKTKKNRMKSSNLRDFKDIQGNDIVIL